ncbi:MAG: beta-hexosaminidase, partial [Alphaproteobacteria bacterium]
MTAAVFGCAGPTLSGDEGRWFARVQPVGFILFGRNVENPDQVRRLVSQLRESVGRADAPVLIDEEGGRVQRLRPPHWPDLPSAARAAREGEEGARS